MARKLKDIDLDEVSLVDEPANPKAKILIQKMKDGERATEDATQTEAASPPKEAIMTDIEKLQADLAEAQKALDAATAKIEEQTKRIEELSTPAEEVEKRKLEAMPADIRKRLEEAEATAKASAEKLAKMEKDAIEKSARERVAKVKGVDAGTLAPIVAKLSQEDGDKVLEALSALSEQAQKSVLFKSIGADGDNTQDGESYTEKVGAAIKKAQEADKDLSYSAAMEKVLAEHDDWFEGYRRETYVRK